MQFIYRAAHVLHCFAQLEKDSSSGFIEREKEKKQAENKTNAAGKCKNIFNKNTKVINVFVLKVLIDYRHQELLLWYSTLMVNWMWQGFFARRNSVKEFCVGVLWFSGCHASCWSCCCGSRAFPDDLAGISVPDRSIGGKVSACRLLLIMSSVLICPWVGMKLNRKCFLSSYACECNHYRGRWATQHNVFILFLLLNNINLQTQMGNNKMHMIKYTLFQSHLHQT